MQSNNSSNNKLKKKIRTGYFIIALIALFPLMSVFLASLLGWCLGCSVNEAGTAECIRWGFNFGETLATMFIMGWALIYSIPLSILLLIVWNVYMNRKLKSRK